MRHTQQFTLDHVPFMRLLLPLMVGIAWQYIAPSTYTLYIWCGVAIVAGVWSWVLRDRTLSTWRRVSFASCVFAFFTAIGMIVSLNATPSHTLPPITDKTTAIARIENMPTEQEYSYNTLATIVALDDSAGTRNCDIKIQLSLQKSFTAKTLQCGELIIFHPELQLIERNAMPYSFDYAQFMMRKGILYRQYLADDTWQLSQYRAPLTMQQQALQIQQQCISSLKRCNLSDENIALLSALLWGYKANIEPSTRQYFSAAGLSHILAVSGLHTGIIALILWLLLYPLQYTPLRHIRGIITLILLWVYAFITGLSPSVVRACIMASFVGVASMLNRPNTSLNALCGSAVMVLLWAPMQLFDIGFQLSYTAVAGIILLSPHLDISNYFDKYNPILRYITGLAAASLAAQIATIPYAAFYFHYIPVWGLLSNLLLTPLLTPLVLIALGMQLLEALHLPHTWLDYATNTICNLLCNGAQAIATLPGATIEGAWISLPMLLLYGTVVVSIWYAISRRSFRPITPALIALVSMQGIILYDSLRPSSPIALLPNERQYTHIQLADNNRNCLIVSTDTCCNEPSTGSEWRIHEHLITQHITAHDTIASKDIYVALPFIEYYGTRILWVDNNTWRYCHTDTPIAVDYAIITEQYKGHIDSLLKSFNIGSIILSASIYPDKSNELIQECIHHNITYHDSRINGLWSITGY